MARLYYMALSGVGPWDHAMNVAGPQLGPYYHYLKEAIRAAEARRPVLEWRPADPAEVEAFLGRSARGARRGSRGGRDNGRAPARTGTWVVLEPPAERPEEPERTFEAFLEARRVFENKGCTREHAIEVNGNDREGRALLLSRLPEPADMQSGANRPGGGSEQSGSPRIWLQADTYPLLCQRHALDALSDRPSPDQAPLIRLVVAQPRWDDVTRVEIGSDEWVFLRADEDGTLRDSTGEQRRFVETALGTPDFALLEGPPGSGKTTAICELIAQLARRQMRVLLVASTHVAVDNVLELLLAREKDAKEKLLLPVRIGDEERVSSDDVRPWTYQNLLRTWRRALLDFLERSGSDQGAGGPARQMLRDALRSAADGESSIERLLLESSNLVCGTTIGILQHPEIKARNRAARGASAEPFDVMILDEASKTTFTEFLVPALHARRWVIVGDVRQLSPYVEVEDLEGNIRSLVDRHESSALGAVHAFLASGAGGRRVPSLVGVDSVEVGSMVAREAELRGVLYANLDSEEAMPMGGRPDAIPALLYADIVFGTPQKLRAFEHRLPGDLRATGGTIPPLPDWEAHRVAMAEDPEEPVDWACEVAWRLVRSYELRGNEDERRFYLAQLDALIPATLDNGAREQLQRGLKNVERVAMPSILELLQRGFERLPGWSDDVALTAGLPKSHLGQRLVSLSHQRRMHPEISRFPREQFYTREGEQLLQDGYSLEEKRRWSFNQYARRAVWVDVAPPRKRIGRKNENRAEADEIMRRVRSFVDWARSNPRTRQAGGGKGEEAEQGPWEVALLTFHRAQEALLRWALRDLTAERANTRSFHPDRTVHVTLCTVDRFQGHEADVVFLSFVKSRSVGFLNSPNRLNVALTRARFQIVLVGHRTFFARCRSPLLRALAVSPHYGHEIGWEAKP